MPDKYGFDHLPERGIVRHRCIEEGCEFPGYGVTLTEHQRIRHHQQHVKNGIKEQKLRQRQAAANARRLQKQAVREAALVEERYG
jgi:hypothetical protein